MDKQIIFIIFYVVCIFTLCFKVYELNQEIKNINVPVVETEHVIVESETGKNAVMIRYNYIENKQRSD